MRLKRNAGFTLIEVIVVAGIIAILAGVLVPMILKEIDESRITRAVADAKSISTAMIVFKKDTAQWPAMDESCGPNVTFLSGAGDFPTNLGESGFNTDVESSYDSHFSTDVNGCYDPNWKGPYIAMVSADPWGNKYITNANSFAVAGQPVWIISAGPNKRMDTTANSATLQGDDIGLRMK